MDKDYKEKLEECYKDKKELINVIKSVIIQIYSYQGKKYIINRKKIDYFI